MDYEALSKLVPINENSYYGKNSHLIKLESYFNDIVEVYKKKTLSKAYGVIEKIENELEILFNFKSVYIETHMVAGIEAYTYPVYVSQFVDAFDDSPFEVKKGKYGPEMANKKHSPTVHIVLSAGVIADMGFTGNELLAVILHEIGHSFDRRPAKIIGNIIMHGTLKVADHTAKVNNKKDKEIVTLRNKYKKDKSFHKELLDQYKQTKKQKKEMEKSYVAANSMFLTQFFTATFLTLLTPIFLISAPIDLPLYINRIDAEKFSDSFAVAFGYSTELTSGLVKLENFAYKPKKELEQNLTPFSRFFYVYNVVLLELVAHNTGTHPDTFKRIAYMSDYLEVCIAEEENPKLKQEMIKSKQQVDLAYAKFVENDLTLTATVKKQFSDLCMLIFKTPDINDIFSAFKHNDYKGLDF